MKDRLEELLAKYWVGQISAEEKEELEKKMWEKPEYWIRSGLLQQVEGKLSPITSNGAADELVERILQKEEVYVKPRKRQRQIKWGVGVLSLLIVVGMVGYFWMNIGSNSDIWHQVATENGMKTTIRLADGTKVWLNAGSSLRYPKVFQQKKRIVYLSGEAYFKVNHNADRPFIIHTAHMDAKVLGTELNVRAYPNEHYSETALIEGVVDVVVDKAQEQNQIRLKPKQKVVIQNKTPGATISRAQADKKKKALRTLPPTLVHKKASQRVLLQPLRKIDSSLIAEIAWKNNTLLFRDEKFEILAKRLNRWYGIHMIIKDSTLARQRFTGRADNVSLKKLLQILQMMKPFNYEIQGEKVIIK